LGLFTTFGLLAAFGLDLTALLSAFLSAFVGFFFCSSFCSFNLRSGKLDFAARRVQRRILHCKRDQGQHDHRGNEDNEPGNVNVLSNLHHLKKVCRLWGCVLVVFQSDPIL
jgi:hypothetical protein